MITHHKQAGQYLEDLQLIAATKHLRVGCRIAIEDLPDEFVLESNDDPSLMTLVNDKGRRVQCGRLVSIRVIEP